MSELEIKVRKILAIINSQPSKLYRWLYGKEKCKKVKMRHAESIISLADKLYIFSIISFFTPLLTKEKEVWKVYILSGVIVFVFGYTLKSYAYSIYEEFDSEENNNTN